MRTSTSNRSGMTRVVDGSHRVTWTRRRSSTLIHRGNKPYPPLHSQLKLVLILLTPEGWKAESTKTLILIYKLNVYFWNTYRPDRHSRPSILSRHSRDSRVVINRNADTSLINSKSRHDKPCWVVGIGSGSRQNALTCLRSWLIGDIICHIGASSFSCINCATSSAWTADYCDQWSQRLSFR